jgi:DNA end-binding protein Ku
MVSFGLVAIPVKLYSTTDSTSGISFNMLHGACKTRLKQQYICPKDNEVVPRDQMVKGYEFAKDQYVLFSEEEMKSMAEESNKAIDIAEFVPAAQVDPLFFDGAYYLGPDKGGERAYRLLAEAMRQTGRSALARWASRGKQYLCIVRAVAGGLVMQTLHYADEIRDISEVPIPDAELKESELKLGVMLIEQIASSGFHPENYRDDVKVRMQAAIDRKVAGEEVILASTEEPRAQIIDLMEALKASLAASPEERRPAKPSPRAADPPAQATQEEAKPARASAGRKAASGPRAVRSSAG